MSDPTVPHNLLFVLGLWAGERIPISDAQCQTLGYLMTKASRHPKGGFIIRYIGSHKLTFGEAVELLEMPIEAIVGTRQVEDESDDCQWQSVDVVPLLARFRRPAPAPKARGRKRRRS